MKPGAYTQLYTHLVFAVKNRECLFRKAQRTELFSYVGGVVTNLKHKSIVVNGYSDHIHILFGQHPSLSVSDTVSEIKRASVHFINEKNWFSGKFFWQDGYGAFSYSRSQVENVYQYILNQELHHQIHKFRDEYIDMLKKAEIKFDDRFLFQFFEDVWIE